MRFLVEEKPGLLFCGMRYERIRIPVFPLLFRFSAVLKNLRHIAYIHLVIKKINLIVVFLFGILYTEMLVGKAGDTATARSTAEESDLHKIRFVDVLQGDGSSRRVAARVSSPTGPPS